MEEAIKFHREDEPTILQSYTQSRRCGKCRKVGHQEKDCMNVKKKCGKCGGKGHTKEVCINPALICNYCRRTGHIKLNCPKKNCRNSRNNMGRDEEIRYENGGWQVCKKAMDNYQPERLFMLSTKSQESLREANISANVDTTRKEETKETIRNMLINAENKNEEYARLLRAFQQITKRKQQEKETYQEFGIAIQELAKAAKMTNEEKLVEYFRLGLRDPSIRHYVGACKPPDMTTAILNAEAMYEVLQE